MLLATATHHIATDLVLSHDIQRGKQRNEYCNRYSLGTLVIMEDLLGELSSSGSTREKLNDFLDFLAKNKQKMANGLEQFTSPVRTILKITAKRLDSLKNRADWRKRLAVKPDWNQNGQYVVYEVSAGEALPVWKGPAASQELDGTPYHLPGGADQLVFFPTADTLAPTRPRIDPGTGKALPGRKPDQIDSRIDWEDVSGRTAPAVLRGKVNDKHVRGPFETGWGFSDWNHSEAKGIMLALPDTQR
ncbi:hypothetical protein [Cupriavidus taiwanensis]|uniref:hypothetical protein n=1 Tax=Cupriavidus taiwanensis TaxID=164546 RepID=UPI000E10DB25|nr:hypothetical protein [Cupriavidus taiwanensis]SPA31251.1 hypothetical protein CBM2637_B110428 [Cupriavidus taiwanensis]SPA56483.1 protein of unknown function [Cupriavidus taiwanensis]